LDATNVVKMSIIPEGERSLTSSFLLRYLSSSQLVKLLEVISENRIIVRISIPASK